MTDEATWLRVVDVAVEQTCQGLLADALSQMPADSRPSKPIYFSMVNMTAEAEDRKTAAEKKEQRDKILAIMAKKRDAKLENMDMSGF